ncbi:unnamed protein product [Symbiodinium natans]|uniref:2'-phosphotransferase n=1 Tax=Symbiodinium natans TaxID=878477 RepID=A0A812UGV8_9DINO|nr:unnamed protein product [Symbiodinium natans]
MARFRGEGHRDRNSIMYNDRDHLSRKLIKILRRPGRGHHLHKRRDGYMLLHQVAAQLRSRGTFRGFPVTEQEVEEIARGDPRHFGVAASPEGTVIRALSKHAPGSVDLDLFNSASTRSVESQLRTVGYVFDAPGPPPLPGDGASAPSAEGGSVMGDAELFAPGSSDDEEDYEQVQDELRKLRQENAELKDEVAALKAENAKLRGEPVSVKSGEDPWQTGADPWQTGAPMAGPSPPAPAVRHREDTQQTSPKLEPLAAPTSGQPALAALHRETKAENMRQAHEENAEPAVLRVSGLGCEQEPFASRLHGEYLRLEERRCGRPVFQRGAEAAARQMVLFYWDDPELSGWYFCPSLDEEVETWAFHAGDTGLPPADGWVAPYDENGEVNPSFRVEAVR